MKKKNLLALLLSLMMCGSTVSAFAACGDDSSSSSSSSSSNQVTEMEELKIINSDFETYDDKDGVYPMVTDTEGWTWNRNTASSGTALESQSASGIIDTQDKAWNNLTTSGLPTGKTAATLTEDEAKQYWKDMTAKDKVEYYDAWEKANPKGDIEDDLDFYEDINIDTKDLMVFKNHQDEWYADIKNPRTHNYNPNATVEENEYGKTHTKVLMLRNNHSSNSGNFIGTALKYTSSTNVTVEAGTCAEFSVWVKTANLRDSRNETVVDKGAYIQITHALGSASQAPLVIKNINTEGVPNDAEHNWGWVQYKFALKASPFASSSFSIVLGLGMGGGTNRLEYVNGVAFFDDIKCETVEKLSTEMDDAETVTLSDDDKIYTYAEAAAENNKFTIDFTDTLDKWTDNADYILNDENKWDIAPTTEVRSGKTYSSVQGKNSEGQEIDHPTLPNGWAKDQTPYPTLGKGFDVSKDVVGVYNNVAEALKDSNNVFAQSQYNDIFKDKTYWPGEDANDLATKKALVLFSARGAAYTAKSPAFNLAANQKILYSFFVKTSAMDGMTGAGVKLVNNEGNPAISSIDTTTATKIEVNEKDIHDGWVQCFFFLHNDSALDITGLHFEFTFGPTTIVDTPKDSYQAGFAVFTNFQQKTMTDTEFDCAVASTYAQKVVLEGKVNTATGDDGFGTPVVSEETNIENTYALLTQYTGVYSDSVLVGGTSTVTNAYKNAGLLNKEHAKNYSTILSRLGATGTTDADKWNSVFGDPAYSATATQPLVIENDATAEEAYGFIGSAASVSAGNVTAVSLRVKVKNSVANVYLIDTSTNKFEVMSVSRNLTYWYDDEGNVLAKDPKADDFSARNHTAFKKQANGLYKVNPTWEGAENVDKDLYFANLQAYDVDKTTKNLLLDSDTTYGYNDEWKHDGNDGVAFYNYNETEKWAYAYSDYATNSSHNVKVYDFANAGLTPRYEAKQSKGFSVEITDTDGKWAEVIFYLQAGDEAKNYRLEVWNGSRDGQTVNTTNGGFVAFDTWVVDSAQTTVDEWLATAKKDKVDGANYFEGVFSFYDNAQFLRYDESLDHNKVGDNYETYLSSANAVTTTYLYTETINQALDKTAYKTYTTYANFATVDKVQSADPVEDEDDTTDDTTDTENPTNVWLLASSIIIAAVLLLAVVSLIVRKIAENVRRKRGVIIKKSNRLKKDKKSK